MTTESIPIPPAKLHDALLRSPRESAGQLATAPHPATTGWLVLTALGSMAVFGFVLGLFSGGDQLWAAPLKLTFGLAFTAMICFPSLCILGALAGSEAGPRGHLAVLSGGLALTGLLLLGFAPVVWVFSQSTRSLGFFGFLGLATWLASMLAGLLFIMRGLRGTTARGFAPLTLWTAVFLLVALQMTSSLRPILGTSDTFLPTEKRFFIEHWFAAPEESTQTTTRESSPDPIARADSPKSGNPTPTTKPPATEPVRSPWHQDP